MHETDVPILQCKAIHEQHCILPTVNDNVASVKEPRDDSELTYVGLNNIAM